jgi:nucleoid-associated protein YgaU
MNHSGSYVQYLVSFWQDILFLSPQSGSLPLGVTRSGKIYLLLLTASLLLCGCDMQHNARRHPLFIKATKLERAGDYPAAVVCFKRFLNVYPESPEAHKALAAIYDDRLLKYLPALYHYDRYLEYNPEATDYADMQKWRDAAKRKFYLKTRREYNDPADVQLLQRKNSAAVLRLKKSTAKQRHLINYIRKVKKEIAAVRIKAEKLKTRTIDLEIKAENSEKSLQQIKQRLEESNRALEAVRALNLKLINEATEDKLAEKQATPAEESDVKTATQAEVEVPKGDDVEVEVKIDNDSASNELAKKPATLIKIEDSPDQELELPVKKPTKTVYLVKAGDTLSRISRNFYGSSKYYRYIMNANKMLLKTAKDLRPGQQLIIPPLKNNK